jgi:hypothetical protein
MRDTSFVTPPSAVPAGKAAALQSDDRCTQCPLKPRLPTAAARLTGRVGQL